jgi:hypothetical protein
MCCKPSTKAFAKVCQLIAKGVKSAPAIMYLAPLCGDRPAPSADLLPAFFSVIFESKNEDHPDIAYLERYAHACCPPFGTGEQRESDGQLSDDNSKQVLV